MPMQRIVRWTGIIGTLLVVAIVVLPLLCPDYGAQIAVTIDLMVIIGLVVLNEVVRRVE